MFRQFSSEIMDSVELATERGETFGITKSCDNKKKIDRNTIRGVRFGHRRGTIDLISYECQYRCSPVMDFLSIKLDCKKLINRKWMENVHSVNTYLLSYQFSLQ